MSFQEDILKHQKQQRDHIQKSIGDSLEKAIVKSMEKPSVNRVINDENDLKSVISALEKAEKDIPAQMHVISKALELNAINSLPESWGIDEQIAKAIDSVEKGPIQYYEDNPENRRRGVVGIPYVKKKTLKKSEEEEEEEEGKKEEKEKD